MRRLEFSRNVWLKRQLRLYRSVEKESMKISSLTGLLRNSALSLLLAALIVGAQAAGRKHTYAESDGAPAYGHYDQRHLRQVQVALRRQGYYAGAADGFLGYKTDTAISKFQLEHEHPVRPLVDRWLLETLGIVKPVVE
jgi:hypothetical protein